MIVVPAIDIIGGKAVRLRKGSYDHVRSYDGSIVDIAKGYAEQGASLIHIVDLDAADGRQAVNADVIESVVVSTAVPLQIGGGLRSYEDIRRALDMGISRVVIGTLAIEDPTAAARAGKDFPDRVVVALDSRNGHIAVRGWKQQTTRTVWDVAEQLLDGGIRDFLCTDIERDGMLSGPNTDLAARLVTMGGRVLISGGIGSIAHLEDLASRNFPDETGVIIGRALYEGLFTLSDAISIMGGGRQLGTG